MAWRETWTYECRGCEHEWREEFEVGRFPDGHGGEVTVYAHLGHRCISPWAELCCPSCGGYDVAVLPTGWGRLPRPPHRRHAELEMLFRLRRLHAY